MVKLENDVLDPRAFRNVVGNFSTGVTVITTKNEVGNPIGFTANSFTSLSLDPKLVLFNIDKNSSNYDVFMNTNYFAINVLASDQTGISKQFSTRGIDRFEGVAYFEDTSGSPILPETIAYLDCKVSTHYEGGDHIIVIGEVLSGEANPNKEPLIFFKGKYLNA
ncbi:NADH-FMN oxidoreductase RutF, flavin reductase (DIM6/NTAB) family [Lentibacillus persicus]|uniref:NADH-FMN oxidoreductase RutF, flavin reductase (DIM6/NTAB) family n=1 Tax=Lentibacillus persicus TaxID=640948 RepID=A0A1I1SFI4_9BACI|nr:flavin reductase family protein [Lentibacillus persicus]SFD43398.1 NADH-FMN oxidoreductase RutF, flavin reductase (DIM6/NTAB) family [Lentibacillus persicus]